MNRLAYTLTAAALFMACGQEAKNIHTMEADDFTTTIEQNHLPIIDVRTAEEYVEGHLPGAVNIDVKQPDFVERISQHLGHNAQNPTVAVYCLRGSRSAKAAALLAKEGMVVYNLAGGITEWKKEGRPLTTE